MPIAEAVLLAAPHGEGDDALLWSPVAGKPLLAWPLAALRAVPEIGSIALVVPAPRLDNAARLIASEGLADVRARALPLDASITATLDLVRAHLAPRRSGARHVAPLHPKGEGSAPAAVPGVIVLHDAARPLVTTEQIQPLVAAAVDAGIAVSAEPVKETIKRVAQGRVVETLPRDELAQLIPPLALRADLLPALLDAPERPSGARIMDLVAAALAEGIAVRTVPLAGPSVAVTSPEDLAVAEALLRAPGS